VLLQDEFARLVRKTVSDGLTVFLPSRGQDLNLRPLGYERVRRARAGRGQATLASMTLIGEAVATVRS
jgi:hypothetical protein